MWQEHRPEKHTKGGADSKACTNRFNEPSIQAEAENEVGSEMHSEQRDNVLGIQANEKEKGGGPSMVSIQLHHFSKKKRRGGEQTLCGKR